MSSGGIPKRYDAASMPPRTASLPAMASATPPNGNRPFTGRPPGSPVGQPPPGGRPSVQTPRISDPARGSHPGTNSSGVYRSTNPSAPPTSQGPQSLRTGPGVLLITEDANLLTTLSRVFVPIHADVITTRSPGEALYALQSVNYERPYRARLVLVDALLSNVDGPTLVAALRRDPRTAGATIALISSLTSQTVENMMRSWGADGYLLTNRGVIHIKTAIDGWLGIAK